MADPLSIAGGAVGIVSLGLQASQGLIAYYSHFKAYDDEIAYITQKSEALHSILQSLEGPLTKAGDGGLSIQVKNAVNACEMGLMRIKSAVGKYGNADIPVSREDKIRALKKRTLYPFRKTTLQDLKITLGELQMNLDLAVNILNLETIQSHKDLASSWSQAASASAQSIETHLESLVAGVNQLTLSIQTYQARPYPHREPAFLASMCVEHQNLYNDSNLLQTLRRKAGKVGSYGLRNNAFCSCLDQPQVSRTQFYSYRHNLSGFWNRTTRHLSHCPRYRFNHRTDTLGAKYSYCTRALGFSISFVTSLTRGAGGFSISPQLTLRSVVTKSSSAFLLVDLDHNKNSSAPKLKFSCSFDHANWILEQLYALFQAGEASPADVLPDGGTLLHTFYSSALELKTIYYQEKTSQIVRTLHHFTTNIMSAGVNSLEPDKWNRTILTCAINALAYLRLFSSELSTAIDMERELLAKLFHCGHEIDEGVFGRPESLYLSTVPLIQQTIEKLPADKILGILQVPDIVKAIYLKNKDSLKEILLHSPESVNRVFSNGVVPLHLAASWPEGLSILLGGGGIVSSYANRRRTPLSCACAEEQYMSVKLLLDYDSPLGSVSDPNDCLENVCESRDIDLARLFISHLVDRRTRLLELALQELPAPALARLELKRDRILDAQAAAVTSALLEHGVNIEAALLPSQELYKTTVYHLSYLDIQMAEALYTAGFRDIDEADANGLTPFWKKVIYIDCSLNNFEELEPLQWLRHQGTNIYRLHSNFNCSALHQLGAAIGRSWLATGCYQEFGLQRSEPTNEQAQIASSFFNDAFLDHCICACSNNGCRIITSALKSIRRPRFYRLDLEQMRFSTSLTICELVELGTKGMQESSPWVPFEVIRTLTFEWLGLTHTCHMDKEYSYPYDYTPPFSDEEIHEIQEEERFLIQEHEELVAEFESKYTELGEPLTKFLNDYWWPRIHEVLDKKIDWDDEEAKKMRELGVVLGERDDSDPDEDEDEDQENVESDSNGEEYESAEEEIEADRE